jgi:hypothetical protein
MVAEGNKINQQNIGYAFAGPNSNTLQQACCRRPAYRYRKATTLTVLIPRRVQTCPL